MTTEELQVLTDRHGHPLAVGDSVRLIAAHGDVQKRHHGRRMTIRALDARCAQVRCDDGAPANADLATNGFRLAIWVSPCNVEKCP